MKIRSHIFGWLTPYLAPVFRRVPERLDLYLELTRPDWHYFGLLIALLGDKAACPDHFAAIEREAWSRARLNVLRDVYDGPARPLLKLTTKFAGDMWQARSYRRVAASILEPAFLATLRRQSRVERRFVRALLRVPSHLRHEAVTSRISTAAQAEQVVFMVEAVRRLRTDMSDQEVLRSLSQTKGKTQLEQWVSGHYQHAPFPAAPWDGDGELQPIKNYPALKQLALEFDNCVRTYHEDVLGGRSYFYRYAPQGKPVATVELEHLPHVGWSMGDVEGVQNKSVSPSVLFELRKRFGSAGIGAMPRGIRRWDLFRT